MLLVNYYYYSLYNNLLLCCRSSKRMKKKCNYTFLKGAMTKKKENLTNLTKWKGYCNTLSETKTEIGLALVFQRAAPRVFVLETPSDKCVMCGECAVSVHVCVCVP